MKKIINTENAPSAIGPYNQAVVHSNVLYISGQIPLSAETNELIEGDFKDKTKIVFENIKQICLAAGTDMSQLIKINVYLADLNNFTQLNEVMSELVPEPFPARAAIEVSRLPKDVPIEIDAIVNIPK